MPINPLDSVCLPAVSIADDSTETAKLFRLPFSLTAGMRVLSAQSGPPCLDSALRGPVSIILLDVVMSGMSEIETCAALRAQPATRQLPTLLLTARDDSASRAACDSASVNFTPTDSLERTTGFYRQADGHRAQ